MALVPAILYKDEIKKQILYHAYDDEMFYILDQTDSALRKYPMREKAYINMLL